MPDATNDRDERLAVIFDRLMQDSKTSSPEQPLEAEIRANPDLEQDLRELWATAMFADDVALLQYNFPSNIFPGGFAPVLRRR